MTRKIQISLLLIISIGLGSFGYYSQALLQDNTQEIKIVTNLADKFRNANKALFDKMGVVYLKNIQIESPVIRQIDAKHTERYLNNPAHYDQLEKKYSLKIAKGEIAPMSVRFINDKIGYGVFAEHDIAKDQFVGEYTGIVMNLADVKDTKYTWDYLSGYDKYGKQFQVSLDAANAGNEMRFVNHDFNPNAVMKYVPQGGYWHAVYIASRPIKNGEQILTDYGKRYWSGTRGEPFKFVKEDGSQV